MKRDISKKIEELLASGTPKQKAALVCKSHEKAAGGEEPLLTAAEERAIYNSFPDGRGGAAFNKWINIHGSMFDYAKLLLFTYHMYRAEVQELVGYIRVWEDYTREADRLNQLLQFMKAKAPKEQKAFTDEVLSLTYKYGEIKREEDGYFTIDIDGANGLYGIIKTKAQDCISYLSYLKAYIVTFEAFVKDNKAEAFVPILLEENIPYAKSDMAEEVAPQYSRTRLLKRKAKGESITPDEEKRAVFPDYDTTEPDPDVEAVTRTKLQLK